MSDDDSDGATEAAQQLALPRELELESSANDIAASSLLAPGLPRHVDSPGGIRAVHRAELAAALDEHVRSLGPPHALVLTGVEDAASQQRWRSCASASTPWSDGGRSEGAGASSTRARRRLSS